MVYRFSLDLKLLRRRAALTQADCAYLLGVDRIRVSRLEAGRSDPSVAELAILCLLYDKPIGTLAQDVILSISQELRVRVETMPMAATNWTARQQRDATLSSMRRKLAALSEDHDE